MKTDTPATRPEFVPGDGFRYVQADGTKVVSVYDDSGTLRRTHSLADMPSDWRVGYVNGRPVKGNFGTGAPEVVSIVCQPTGITAISRNQAGAVVSLLSDGQHSVAMEGAGGVLATSAFPGGVAVLAYDVQRSPSVVTLYNVDTDSMRLRSTTPLGITMTQADQVYGASIVPIAPDRLLVHTALGGVTGGPMHGTLLDYSIDSATFRTATLEDDAGLVLMPLTTDQAVLFGGPARNVVHNVDVATLRITGDNLQLQAPAGTYMTDLAGSDRLPQ